MERLQEEVKKAVCETDSQINLWAKFRSDYKELKSRLDILPHSISQNIMVPFGKKMHIPGKLVHTNEILVLLGDNYFVDRSAKQAADIVQRRLTDVEENLSNLKQQRKLLTDRASLTEEIVGKQKSGEYVDIREEFDEKAEEQWRKNHAKKVQQYRKTLKDEPLGGDRDVWDRLSQLEIIEKERNELNEETEGSHDIPIEASSVQNKNGERKRVRFDLGDHDKDEHVYSDDDDAPRLYFHHSHTSHDQMEPVSKPDRLSKLIINSPADIYIHYLKMSRKSDVDKGSESKSCIKERSTEHETHSDIHSQVLMKDVQENIRSSVDTRLKCEEIASDSLKDVKISKFKRERLKAQKLIK